MRSNVINGTQSSTVSTPATTITTATHTYSSITTAITFLNSPTLVSSDSHSDNNSNKLSAEVIVAIVILLIIVFVTIIEAVIRVTVVWKERKSKYHTKEKHVYSTINETKLQKTPQSKPEIIHSELIDVQVSKEEPRYMKTSKNAQSTTIAEKVAI